MRSTLATPRMRSPCSTTPWFTTLSTTSSSDASSSTGSAARRSVGFDRLRGMHGSSTAHEMVRWPRPRDFHAMAVLLDRGCEPRGLLLPVHTSLRFHQKRGAGHIRPPFGGRRKFVVTRLRGKPRERLQHPLHLLHDGAG